MCLGVPAEVIAIPESGEPRARVAISGVERTVATDLIAAEELRAGDWVLVHVGFALSRIDAEEAAITLEQIRRLGGTVLDDELAAFGRSAID
ncbi:HypC/HybG/HupF family hydrogenase formation chaperone [Raineyella fluvialis]|uniref:HypC/HybG/HupF family hydrogenase formation chaperone n=1 Tax=Raineyella fluvialis TaxID=2662261 RepID=A0A5Q2FFN8_9ACTN|nr:HypC/HybG/HupF family hydrogenase formation chaperone [Raineyella fluvialis]QGF23106.1 HypC/HybG/HupF family hydrogenase formation chaperone [Raineyella fluvialis]